ncbi:MAG: hypothetical protein WB799_23540 [Candidatus Sulfotelmatobacter sp.]
MSAEDSCDGGLEDVSGYFYGNWTTANTSIATVNYSGTHTGVAVGTTTSKTSAYLQSEGKQAPSCPSRFFDPSGGDNVAVPTGEITEFEGVYQISAGQFLMTLTPSTSSYDGNSVKESSPVVGTNTCWWNGSNMDQYPTVAGSTWVVDQGDAGHNQYGLDTVGFGSGVVNLIQTQGAAHDVEFPCVVTIYQEMNYDGIDPYATNLLTQTIGSNTVKVCRAGVCSGTIAY